MDKETVEFILEQNQNLKKDFRNSLADLGTAISARVDHKIDQKLSAIDKKVDKILLHNDRQNGWIKQHRKKLDDHERMIDNLKVEADAGKAQRSRFNKLAGNWYWILAGFLIGWFILYSIADKITISMIIDFFTTLF